MDAKAKPTVLLVDDELILHEMLLRMLEDHFQLLNAYSVDEALALFEQHTPDIVCTDLMMPIRSGLDLIAILKNDPQTTMVPIVVISATGHEAQLRQAMALGAYEILSKPFGRIDLINTLKNALDMDSDDI